MLSFSERLREVRKELGLSQVELAERAGVTAASQVNYEKGARKPDTAYLEAIAAHGVDVLYVVTGRRTPKGAGVLSDAESALLESYTLADDAGRAALQAVAELAKRTAGAKSAGKGNTVTIGGDVGQAVAGDQTNNGPTSFSVGKGRK